MEQIISSIRKIVRAINLESKKIDKAFGISIPQMLCLSMLNQSQNYQSNQKDLAEKLNLNASTMSGIIDRLEKKGLLARLPKQGDKRTTIVTLTSKGSGLLRSTPDLLQNRLLNRLVNAPFEEVSQIETGLNLLIKYLQIQDIEAANILSEDDLPI